MPTTRPHHIKPSLEATNAIRSINALASWTAELDRRLTKAREKAEKLAIWLYLSIALNLTFIVLTLLY